MKDFDEQDDLWQLLGKAKKNAVSPLFSRNVLREVRLSRQEQPGVLSWLRARWRLATLGSVAIVLLALNFTTLKTTAPVAKVNNASAPLPQIATNAVKAAPAIKAEDTEVITHLDELLAYEENNIWLEDSGK